MSADNFVAILVTPREDGTGKEYRVGELRASEAWHQTGFDGLHDSGKFQELKPWAYDVWFESEVYLTEEASTKFACNYEDTQIVEYGRATYEFPFPFTDEWQKK